MTDPDRSSEQAVLHIYMADQGTFLSTREAGREAVENLRRITEAPGDVLLDFEGVEAAAPPFLQELSDAINALILARQGGRIVLAANMTQDVADTLRYVAVAAKRDVVYSQGDQLDLLEDRPHLVETLREAQRLKPFFTAPELAERLHINSDTATQRLRRLVDFGAAVRQNDPAARRGVRHIYRVADPRLADAGQPGRRRSRRRKANVTT